MWCWWLSIPPAARRSRRPGPAWSSLQTNSMPTWHVHRGSAHDWWTSVSVPDTLQLPGQGGICGARPAAHGGSRAAGEASRRVEQAHPAPGAHCSAGDVRRVRGALPVAPIAEMQAPGSDLAPWQGQTSADSSGSTTSSGRLRCWIGAWSPPSKSEQPMRATPAARRWARQPSRCSRIEAELPEPQPQSWRRSRTRPKSSERIR